MKKIKKILLLLLAFSFTTLLFNSQAYAVEYYTFEFEITDVTDAYNVIYTPNDLYYNIRDFLVENAELDVSVYSYEFNGWIMSYDITNEILNLSYNFEVLSILNDLTMVDALNENGFEVGIYTITTEVPITFTKTFWDNIIDAIDEAANALSSAASAGFGLIYDGTNLTALGSALIIPIGLGLVLGVFYLIIRLLPSVRL